jgi:tetratricopeptide (TPR) repeat protein
VLPSDDSAEPNDEPRHPFTYRTPAERETGATLVSTDDVADEARRNDAMLVWAAGLIAVMFACTTIADSRVLVHVKTGQYLAAHGVLPPRTDVFSASAGDRPWVNLGWLFDLIAAGLHAVGGMTALTILQCVAAVGLVVLVFASRQRGVSSWWAAFVVALMAVAAMPHFEASPHVVTLLGVAATLWLVGSSRGGDHSIWWLVPVFLVWANLDPRMFLGLAILLLYGVGELLGSLIGRPRFDGGAERGRYWLAIAASVLATLVNPFLWHAPLGGLRLYAGVDPAFREYYRDEVSWLTLPHVPLFRHPPAALLDTALLAGMLLCAVSLVALVLNRRRLNLGDLLLWLGFVGFGILAGREVPVASVVFAVLAIRNAEDWYRNSFRQTYGTDRGELLFARGGRAITVLAFAALAGLWLTGRIVADDGRRPGFGLDPMIESQVESFAMVLDDPFNRKVFDFHAAQGDLLIWLGFQPFIDHRLEIFAGKGPGSDGDLIAQHDDIRHALLIASAEDSRSGRPDLWKPALDAAGIVQAMPRLTFPFPSYRTYFGLLQSPDWRLLDLGAAAAVFYRTDSNDPKLRDYLSKHSFNLTEQAFRDPGAAPKLDPVWPRERTWTDTLTRRARVPNRLARALHSLQHIELAQSGTLRIPAEASFAFAYLALRDCYATLAEDPQNSVAYQCLGRVYELLYALETQGSGIEMRRRLYQSLDAYGQALTIAPDDPATHQRLVTLYLGFNKLDLAAFHRDRYEQLTGREFPKPGSEQAASQWDAMWDQVEQQVSEITKRTDDAIAEDQPRLDAVLFAWQNGCTRLALSLIDADPEFATQSAEVRRLKALLLLESARPHEAFDRLRELEQIAPQGIMSEIRDPLAYASLALPDFDQAKALWHDEASESAEAQLMAAMQAVPFVGALHGSILFPLVQTTQSVQSMVTLPQKIAENEFNAILCDLEAGRIDEAEKSLNTLLTKHPLTPFTPLAGFYLEQIRGRPFQLNFPAGGKDRYAAVEASLDEQAIAEQISTAGPVEAPKPKVSRSRPGLDSQLPK